MIDARFRIELPDGCWIDDVSRSQPEASYRLLAGVRTDNERAVELGEVIADDPGAASRAVADHSAIVEHRRLEADDQRVLSKYETTDTALYGLVTSAGVPPEFPIVAENGWYEFDFTGTRAVFDRFRETLDELGPEYELVSLVEARDPSQLLSDRQRTVLEAALRAGYFEVPRQCTLADLANDLGVDKSAASRTLRRGAARVLQWYLTSANSAVDR